MPKGGVRPGAGRPLGGKNSYRKQDKDNISWKVLSSIDSIAIWKKLLRSNSPKVVVTGLMYLMDRVFGRPAQTIQGGSEPLKIEFSWNGTPDWLKPSVSRVVGQLTDKSEE